MCVFADISVFIRMGDPKLLLQLNSFVAGVAFCFNDTRCKTYTLVDSMLFLVGDTCTYLAKLVDIIYITGIPVGSGCYYSSIC